MLIKGLAKKAMIAGVRFFSSLGVLVFSLYVTKEMGVEKLGLFMSVFSVVLGVATVSRFGSDLQALKVLSVMVDKREYIQVKKYIFSVYSKVVIGAAFVFFSLASISYFLGWVERGWLFVFQACLMLPMLVFSKINAAVIRSLGKTISSVFYDYQFAFMLTGLWLLLLGESGAEVTSLIFIFLMALLVMQFAAFIQIGVTLHRRKAQFPMVTSDAKSEAKVFNYDYMVSTTVSYLNQWSVILLSGLLLSSTAAGIATVAQKSAAILSFVITIYSIIYSPSFAVLGEKGREAVIKKGKKITREMTVIAVPCVAFYFLFGEKILSLFDENLAGEAFGVLLIFVIAHFFNISFGLVGAALNMTGRERKVKNIAVLGVMVGLSVIYFLGSLYGLYGYVAGYAFSMIFQNVVMSIVARKEFGATFTVFKW